MTSASGAFIGGYTTLADAYAATEDGGTIYLLEDVSEGIEVASAKTFSINAGEFTYSGAVTAAEGFGIVESTSGASTTYTVFVAVAQIGTTKYETVEAALTDAQVSGATIEILADSTETPDHALEVLMGGNITLTAATPVRVEIAPTAKTSSVDNDGMAYIRSASAAARCTFTVGENVTLAFPATAVGKGAMYIGYSAATPADMVINGRLELYEPYVGSLSTLTVNPSGSIKSISECLIVRWGATVDIVGTGAEWSDANPQAEFGYVWLQGGVTTLKDTYAKGGAWVQTWNRNADKVGQYGDTTLALDNSVLATSKINNQVVIAMDCDSQIVTPVVQNTGSINIDATGITAPFKAIDYTGSGTMALANYGTVNVTGGEAYVEESDLWVKKLPVAQIVTDAGATTTKYATLAAAVADAQSGDTIEMIADVTGENVTVTKSVTITGASDAEGNPAITLENTQLTLSGTMVELAVTNLAFTGSSYINANNGKALTVDHVTAVVDPTKCGNCSRSAFIVLSATEHTTGLDLTVTHSTIVNTSGTDSYGAAIFGWAYLKSATICDNVLGSDSYRFRFIAVKLMNAVDGATYTIERNMVYGTNARYRFYAFDLYQNCSRDNSYTAVSKDNVVDVTATGSYDFFVFDIERNGSVSTKTIVIDSDSTLNGKAVTLNDFRNELNVNAGFYGAGVVYDANGKMTAGTFNRELSDAELEEFVAEGLRSFAVGDGTYTLDVPVAQIGDVKYASFEKAIADAQGGDTILLLADATLDAAVTVSMSLTITLDGHSITGTITAGTGYELVTSDTAYVVRGAGYAGEVLPAGPDMSGDVINVTAANAQYTLDGAYGDINGKTINFTESIAAVLELCRATKYEGSGTSYKIGYNTDNLPLPWSEENIATIKAHNGMMTYYRTVSNIVFTANQGVTLQGFAFTNGYHETGKYDFAREITVNDSGFDDKYVNLTSLNNITFEDLTFNGNVTYSVDVYHRGLESTSVSGITFNGCSFANTSAAAIHMLNDENTAYIDNTVVSNCTFTSVHQGVYVNKPNGATIVDNYFYGTGHNAIAMQSDNNSASRAGGDITIIGNYATGVGDRVVRFNYVGADANITINNNVFLKTAAATASESDVIKGTDIASGATVDLEYTYWNGATTSDAIKGAFTPFLPTNTGINSGTWKVDVSDYVAPGYAATDNGDGTWTVAQAATPVAQIGDVTYTTLAAAIDAAEEYKAEHDEYPTITVLEADAAAAELDAASDWKISGDELVRKNVIATLAQGGALVGKYEDLHVALEAGKAVGSVVTLLVDVDLDGVTWVPVADFAGTFDGNNKTISNLTINDNTLYPAGLFSVTGYGATIKNLTLDDPTVIGGKEYIGALVGKLWASTVTNCHVTGAITVSGYHCVGGLTGFADYSQVVDCSIVGDSKATASVVGIYDDDIEDGDNVGGLIGMGGTASPLYSSIEVMEPKDLDKEATIGCTVRNITVKGTRKVGGLVGQIYSTCSVSNAVVSSVNVTTTATEEFASKKSGTMGVGGMAGMFVFYTDSNTGKYGRIGQFAGKVSDVNVTSENAAVDAYAWMGVISGGQRDASTDFVIPQGLTFAVTVKGKNLTTGAHVTDNTTAIYSAKPVTCSVTFDLGTNYPTGAEKPADGAYAVGEELPLPNYESANTSFAGWKVDGSDPAVIITVLPAGTTGDITLVATWTGAKTIQINAGGTEPTTIKVTDEWLEANGLADEEDTAKIRAALEKSVNSVPAWESYVLGQSIGAAVSSGAEQGETTLMPVTSTIDVPAVDTGFDVQYRLDKVDASGNVVAEGTAQATPDLALELSGVASSAYYRLVAVVTAKDGSGASVSVQANNTIGVLAVNSAAKSMIVAVPWASLDDGGEISVSNLVRTATLTPGDTINAYDAKTKKYKAWTLSNEKVWEPTPVIGGSGESEAGDYTVPRGAGVWLTRSDTSKPLYLVGGTSASAVVTDLEPSDGVKPAWNLVASPSVEPVNLSTLLSGKEDQAGVVVPTAGAPKTYTFKGGAWGYDTTEPVMKNDKQVGVRSVRKTDDVTVPAGTGFWYLNSSESTDVKIEW